MKKWIQLLLIVTMALISLSAWLAIAFRRRDPDTMRRIAEWNRRHLNPRMLRLAGKRGWNAASLHHMGRTTGRALQTPVVVHRSGSSCLVPLPYGAEVDWLKNLQARGSGSMVDHGLAFGIANPRVVTQQRAFEHLDRRERARYRWYGVAEFAEFDITPMPEPVAQVG